MNKFKKGKILDVQRSKKISIIMEKSISKSTVKNIHYIISKEGRSNGYYSNNPYNHEAEEY